MAHLAAYLRWLQQQHRYSVHTQSAARRDLIRLCDLLGAASAAGAGPDQLPAEPVWESVSTDPVRTALSRARAQGASPATLARMASSWRQFFRYLMDHGVLQNNPLEGVRAPRKPRRLPKALSPDEALLLLTDSGGADQSAAQASVETEETATAADVQTRVLAELLYGTGLRISEALGLDRSEEAWLQRIASGKRDAAGAPSVASALIGGWIDWAAGEAHVTGKGNKARVVPLTQTAIDVVHAWLRQPVAWASGFTERPLFVSVRGRRLSVRSAQAAIAGLASRAGFTRHVHPHMLRHSYASHVLQSSGDLRAVQELMGHASISSTQVYTALDFQHLSAVYDQAHPRARRQDVPLAPPPGTAE